jgi:uncharacterized lipoprotein YmbA
MRLLLLATLAPLLALAACASPNPNLYTLDPIPPAAAPASLSTPAPVIELRRVAIPGSIDRPEIVRSASDYRVHLTNNDRWSEPLGDLVQRVLVADLTTRLPGAVVYSDTGPISATPTAVVEVNLAQFAANGAGQVVLDAQIAVRPATDNAPALTRTIHLTQPIPDQSTADYAAALSTATAQLADIIATLITRVPGV